MPDGFDGGNRRSELVDVIHRVRNRWRMRLALSGAVIVVAGTLLALLLSASSLEALKFSTASIISFRIVALLVFAGLVWVGLVLPLRRRVTDTQVALYLEECDPTLEAAILSAVESSKLIENGETEMGPSPQLVEKLVEQAIERCSAIDDGLAIERERLRRQVMTLAGIAAAAALLIAFGPAYLRHGLSALLVISRSAEAASPYHIDVQPGNTKVPRGADQTVKAKLRGSLPRRRDADGAQRPGASFDARAARRGKGSAAFEGMLFHVEKTTEYYVESNGVESPHFTMDVVDLPTVQNLVLEYHFPAYTGLQPRTVDPGGDVAAIQGTDVRLKITPTMKSDGGRVLLNDSVSIPLTTGADGTLAGNFTVDKQGFYSHRARTVRTARKVKRVAAVHDRRAERSHAVGALHQAGPRHAGEPRRRSLRRGAGRRRLRREAGADVLFGERRRREDGQLFGGSKALPEVTASHTIYLEELGLKPGDFVSYYAKATDNDGVEGGKTTTSDIYFVQIRPFKKDYKPAQSQAGGGGGGGGGQQVGQLSQQQREIVAATFNIVRDKAKTKPEKFRENVVFLHPRAGEAARAGRGAERQDEQPARRRRSGVQDDCRSAAESGGGDEGSRVEPEGAAGEGSALARAARAEAAAGRRAAVRGAGLAAARRRRRWRRQSQQMSEDLADLFELELDKLANQYEMQQRAEQQGGDQQVDELAEKLKELARRQQQEAERQRRLAASNVNGGGGGDAQRQLAQELEEAARRLEQLTRDQPKQNLTDAARQLQDAANAMRQAAANGSKDGGAQAAAALDKLREAQQKLQQNQSGRSERDIQDAKRQAEALANEQKDIEAQVDDLNKAGRAGPARQGQGAELAQRKDAMDQKVADLQDQLEKLANEARNDNRNAARKLDEAAGSITDKRVREKIPLHEERAARQRL